MGGQETGICMHACALNVPSQDCPMHIESFRSNLSSNVSQRLKDKVIISANIDASGQYIPPWECKKKMFQWKGGIENKKVF